MSELIAESIARLGISEVTTLFTPTHDGVDHASDQLAHRAFALRRTGLAVKIFTGDDVGGGLRPALGHLDTFLAEDGHALFVADQRGTPFPFDELEWRRLAICEKSLEKYTSAAPCGSLSRFQCSFELSVI